MFVADAQDESGQQRFDLSFGICSENSSGNLGLAGFVTDSSKELEEILSYKVLITERAVVWKPAKIGDTVAENTVVIQKFIHKKTNNLISYHLARITDCPYQVIGLVECENGTITKTDYFGWVFEQDEKSHQFEA